MSETKMDLVSDVNRAGADRIATGSAKALVKGLALVRLVADSREPVRLAALTEASGLPRPTALRLLDALVTHQLLRLTPGEGYALGPQLAVWGQRYLDGLDVRRLAGDIVERLARETRETCFLGIRDQREVLYVAKADSPQAVRPAAGVGSRNPLHSTAIGKALLAFGDPALVEEYLAGPLMARTPNTITEPQLLRADLAVARGRGWSADDIENEDGVRCTAAPVYDHSGQVVAALSVSAPAYRFSPEDRDRWAPRVVSAAAELTARLGLNAHKHEQGSTDG